MRSVDLKKHLAGSDPDRKKKRKKEKEGGGELGLGACATSLQLHSMPRGISDRVGFEHTHARARAHAIFLCLVVLV